MMVKNRNLFVDALSVTYGLGSWIAMTGLWVELPLMMQRLPESWTLGASLTLTLQVANLGPLIYGYLQFKIPKYVNEISGTHSQLLIGFLSTLLMIFLWDYTVPMGSTSISLPLYILAFGLSIVDCTSSVVFLPYMARFKSIYLIPYLVGEGFSGLLPSLVAAAQGIGEKECRNISQTNNASFNTSWKLEPWIGEPRFEPEWFFFFLLLMVLISWIAFYLLERLEMCKREMIGYKKDGNDLSIEMKETKNERNLDDLNNRSKSTLVFYLLLAFQGWASIATFGVFPAIQSFSCLPYGYSAMHYAVTLGGVAYPAACLIAMFWEIKKLLYVSVLTFIATFVSAYLMYTAVLSPVPPLVDSTAGGPIIVTSWVLFISIFSYVKTVVTVLLSDSWGQRGLFWCGVVTQAGAAIGALLMFFLVNVFEFFEDDQQC